MGSIPENPFVSRCRPLIGWAHNGSHLPFFRCTSEHQGLGYAGISNMLAVEFDTYYNAEMLEPYENHVSVQTRWGQLSSGKG